MVTSGVAGGGPHEVADVHVHAAGAPGDGRADAGELEVEARLRHRARVGLHGGAQGLGGGDGLVVVGGGDEVLGQQPVGALGLEARAAPLRPVARERAARLLERGAERARVQLEQHLAGRHVLPLAEGDAPEHAADLRAHRRPTARARPCRW